MAVNFTGVAGAQALDLGLDLGLLRNVSGAAMMAWVRPRTSSGGSGQMIVGAAVGPPPGTDSTHPRLAIALVTGLRIRVSVTTLDAGVTQNFSSATLSSSLGQWIHAAAVMDYVNNVLNVYENGVLISTTGLGAGANTSDTNSKNAAIGANINASGLHFDGDIEDVRIYGRILGTSEILTIYTTCGKDGIWSGCQARYLMTERGIGQPVILSPSLGTVNRSASPVNAPNYSAGITVSRRRGISPG